MLLKGYSQGTQIDGSHIMGTRKALKEYSKKDTQRVLKKGTQRVLRAAAKLLRIRVGSIRHWQCGKRAVRVCAHAQRRRPC